MVQGEEQSAQQNIEIESLKTELSAEIEKNLVIEERLREKTSELSNLNENLLQNLNEENKKLKETIESEMMKNKELLREIETMSLNLKQNLPILDNDIQTKILEEAHQQEKERWVQETRSLRQELGARNKKMADLQQLLDKESEKYKVLESQMSDSDRNMKKRSDTLQRNLEQLNLMYHQLVSQQSILKLNKSIHERKIARLTDKNAAQEKALKDAAEKLMFYEREIEEYKSRLEMMENKNRHSVGPRNLPTGNNIKKIIRGGGDLIFKTPRSKNQVSVFSNPGISDDDAQD